jgi:hypothetical protein
MYDKSSEMCLICSEFYTYFTIPVVENVFEVALNIHTLFERVGIELLKRLEHSIVVLLLTTIGYNHPCTATR